MRKLDQKVRKRLTREEKREQNITVFVGMVIFFLAYLASQLIGGLVIVLDIVAIVVVYFICRAFAKHSVKYRYQISDETFYVFQKQWRDSGLLCSTPLNQLKELQLPSDRTTDYVAVESMDDPSNRVLVWEQDGTEQTLLLMPNERFLEVLRAHCKH